VSDRSIDPHDAVDFIYRQAPKYAQAKADRIYLEEFRKSKKALLMKESGLPSVAAQEVYAYAHPDYQAHLDGLRAAVELEETLRWGLVAAQMRGELYRTISANNRNLDRAAQ
jgi:hypothetical protein